MRATAIVLGAALAAGCGNTPWAAGGDGGPPGDAAPWGWQQVGAPGGAHGVYAVAVDPEDESHLIATTLSGIYRSTMGPRNTLDWTLVLAGRAGPVRRDPEDPRWIYAASSRGFDCAVERCLYRSADGGLTWARINRFAGTIRSLLVDALDPAVLYVGLQFYAGQAPAGLYACRDRGAACKLHPFGVPHQELLLWDIAQDRSPTASFGTLYVSTEKWSDSNRSYPPLLRSVDLGHTWTNLSGTTLYWHVIDLEIHPITGAVLAKEEGPELWISHDQGERWKRSGSFDFQSALVIDESNPQRLYGGAIEGFGVAGVFSSWDGGQTFTPFGLTGMSIASLALSADGRWLFAGVYDVHGLDGGVYRIALGDDPLRAP